MQKILVILVVFNLLGSCGLREVECTFRFPDEEAFLMADKMRLEVYPLANEDDVPCDLLMMGQPIPDKALIRKLNLDPCEVMETTPAIPLGEFEEQWVTIFGEVKGEDNVALLRACVTSYLDDDKIDQVDLTFERTDHYPESVTPSCASKEQKCNFSALGMPCP